MERLLLAEEKPPGLDNNPRQSTKHLFPFPSVSLCNPAPDIFRCHALADIPEPVHRLYQGILIRAHATVEPGHYNMWILPSRDYIFALSRSPHDYMSGTSCAQTTERADD